jgi:hypothetical protein
MSALFYCTSNGKQNIPPQTLQSSRTRDVEADSGREISSFFLNFPRRYMRATLTNESLDVAGGELHEGWRAISKFVLKEELGLILIHRIG